MGAPSSLGTNLSTSSSSQSATAQATQAPPMAAPPAPGSLPRGSYEAKSHPSNASSAAFARYTHAINDAELDEIRARLEALLPNGD